MPKFDGAFIDGLLSTPLVLPAPVAGALAALFFVMVVVAVRRAARDGGPPRLIVPLTVVVVGGLVVIAVLDRMTMSERAADRRALLARNTQLNASVVAPGSALACLDGVSGEPIENACEKAVFADAQSAASAVVYVAARLSLLSDAFALAQRGDPDMLAQFATMRRAIELDRYGIAAHVLAVRDGCTAERCAIFAVLQDNDALKANLKVHAFEGYVTRYAAAWTKTEPAADKQPQATAPAPAPVASAAEPQPVDSRYDFPSAASIPPVSIMNAEPMPKEQVGTANAQAGGDGVAANPPVPPKRPQTQAASPLAR
jgi:hypothetical protein